MSEQEQAAGGEGNVVVGVDGSPAGVAALRYAVAEAGRLGVGVRVLHAVQTYVAMAPRYPLPVADMTAAGRAVLRDALRELGPTPPSVSVATTLARGGAVEELAAAGRTAALLVVGSDRRPVVARLFTGNVSTGVAARSSAPVVAVPETWPAHRPAGVVLVGIKRPDHADDVLAQAFALADARKARLRVVHAWQLPGGYDDMIARHAVQDWDDRARVELERAVAPWRAAHPDVDVELRTVHDQPAHALVSASAEADELLLVRRPHAVQSSHHLGSTARAVLAHAHCPVRVVPAGDRSPTPDPVLDEAVLDDEEALTP